MQFESLSLLNFWFLVTDRRALRAAALRSDNKLAFITRA